MTSEKLAPVKKLPSQAIRKFCFQFTSLLMIVHLLFKKTSIAIITHSNSIERILIRKAFSC
ncbi:hypothetical protein E0E04_04805 [Streptococcus vicugnae]|uniref:Uncharacterized protein n=1 Tax=Streptococcus vicugnae TaxID=2740579 RepID=A0A4R5G5N6_9STRE|nr:hypothetical protein E0E04_04805 [Streptococcus vicugnae]